jgi:hypothetical protein
MNGKITVTIDLLGRPKIEGHGFVGKECDVKMKPIEDAFKGESKRRNKPEYDRPTPFVRQPEQIPQ